MSELFFTADLHFGHTWMATKHRHWCCVLHHDEELIRQWNETIRENDTVYVLGDFSFHRRAQTEKIFHRLNGAQKFLILGNHDPKHVAQLPWDGVWDFRRVKHEGQSIYCFHYPMLTWPNAHYGTWHLHGHSHGNLRAAPSARMDVGIDATSKIAVSVEEVGEWMKDHPYDYIDHHESETT